MVDVIISEITYAPRITIAPIIVQRNIVRTFSSSPAFPRAAVNLNPTNTSISTIKIVPILTAKPKISFRKASMDCALSGLHNPLPDWQILLPDAVAGSGDEVEFPTATTVSGDSMKIESNNSGDKNLIVARKLLPETLELVLQIWKVVQYSLY